MTRLDLDQWLEVPACYNWDGEVDFCALELLDFQTSVRGRFPLALFHLNRPLNLRGADEIKPDRVIDFGTKEFFDLLEQLAKDNRQGEVAMTGEVIIILDTASATPAAILLETILFYFRIES